MGKPRIFKDENEFYNKFKEYIKYCKKEEKLPNIAGFSVFANINRDTFYDQKEFYIDTFKKIEAMLEDEAINCKVLGDARVIFYMKNKCGYKDKLEAEENQTTKNGVIDDLMEALKNVKRN